MKNFRLPHASRRNSPKDCNCDDHGEHGHHEKRKRSTSSAPEVPGVPVLFPTPLSLDGRPHGPDRSPYFYLPHDMPWLQFRELLEDVLNLPHGDVLKLLRTTRAFLHRCLTSTVPQRR